jgi:hypothetical protein
MQKGESPPGWPQVAQTVICLFPAIDIDGSHSNAHTLVGTTGIVDEQHDPVDHAPTTLTLPVSLTTPPHPVGFIGEYDINSARLIRGTGNTTHGWAGRRVADRVR